MGRWPVAALLMMIMFMAACSPERTALDTGPVLVQDVTLAPTTPSPTRVLSATPSPISIPVSTSELTSPLLTITRTTSFIVVTPTLPPSKTPTQTPTQTVTPRATRQPSLTPTFFVLTTPISVQPPSVVILATSPPVLSNQQPGGVCSIPWFFANPIPATCPSGLALASAASFQQFQNGVMVWVGQQDGIYVFFDSANFPRWQVFNDTFEEGMPDIDPGVVAPAGAWQPRRGFGLLWRAQPTLQSRLGWAVTESEQPFTIQIQIGADGLIYLNEPRGGIYSLIPDGSDWKRFAS